jgi:hypothetical protein
MPKTIVVCAKIVSRRDGDIGFAKLCCWVEIVIEKVGKKARNQDETVIIEAVFPFRTWS